MAKGKSVNPADAYRKAQRKKELKKNKTDRQKARDFAIVKKDTTEVEEEIEQLEAKPEPSSIEQARLKELKADLEKIIKKKEDYVAEHPEHRKLVFKAKRRQPEEAAQAPAGPTSRNLFNKNGLPRHPERSIYYDPVMNPFGVAPPGMPYAERPLRPDEIDSDQEDDQNSDEDIVMPEGPPPGEAEGEDSDDDIPMPEGPPPGQGPDIPPPPTFPMSPANPPFPTFIPQLPAAPPPPAGVYPGGVPPTPFPYTQHVPPPPGGLPPLPAGFPLPPPPPGFFSRRSQSSGAMQDPLSSVPHKTYQAHQAAWSHVPPPPPLPSHTQPPSLNVSTAVAAAATVSAAPELRDLKKESTAFLPTSLKRKKAVGNSVTSMKLNAAPSVGTSAEEPAVGPVRPDLVGALREQFGGVPVETKKGSKTGQSKDDYEKFVAEMGDILR